MPMAGNGPGTTPLQDEFIEWLVDPAKQGSQKAWAEAHGVSESLITKWKNDLRFKKAWERRCAELNIDPGRIQKIIDAMFKAAVDGDVKAMSLYLQYVDRFTPTTKTVVEDKSVAEMSDDELADELADNVVALRSKQA